jgi:hypothetical protein
MERFRDQEFARLRAVGIRRIDQVDSELDCALENFARFVPILGPTPDSLTRNPHGAKPEPIDRKIASDFERGTASAAGRCRSRAQKVRAGREDRCPASDSEPDKSATRQAVG